MIQNAKINGIGWKVALSYICGIIAVTQLIIVAVWLFRIFDTDNTSPQQKWTVIETDAHEDPAYMRGRGEVLQEIACSPRTSLCFYIIDGPSKFTSGYGRWLGVESLADVVLASVDLDNRYYQPLTAENSRNWPVVVDRISIDYVKLMVAQPFLLGTFLNFEMSNVEDNGESGQMDTIIVEEKEVTELEVPKPENNEKIPAGWKCVHPSVLMNCTSAPSDVKGINDTHPETDTSLQLNLEIEVVKTVEVSEKLDAIKEPEGQSMKILCIGLGAAVIGNFFAFNFPKEHQITVLEPEPTLKYLAQKYFGLNETAQYRVFVVEPIHYLVRRAHKANKGNAKKKFDFIVVDSCYYTTNRPGLCPTEEYTRPLGIAPLKKLLNKNGTIVVNVFPASRGKWQEIKALSHRELDVLRRYRGYFSTCYYVASGSNLILVCTDRKTEKITQHSYAELSEAAKLSDYMESFADLEPPTIYAN